jgi:hypothetical protein
MTTNLISSLRRTVSAIALGAGVLAASTASFAATDDIVNFGGSVSSTLAIVATDTNPTLDLTTPTERIVKVADIAMTTNNATGLTLTADSGNMTTTGGATPIAFLVQTVVDAAAPPVSVLFVIASGDDYTVGSVAAGNLNNDLYIRYEPAPVQDPGVYAGSINLTVSDN